MNADEVLEIQNLHLVFLSLGIHSAYNGGHVTKYGGVHQCCNIVLSDVVKINTPFPTSNEHDDDGEYFLLPGVGGHVAEADGGEGGACEVEGGGVGVQVRDQRPVGQLVEAGQLVHPAHVHHTRVLRAGNIVIIARQVALHLIAADHNPDAGQPVRDEDEADHEETQNDGAVLVKSAH